MSHRAGIVKKALLARLSLCFARTKNILPARRLLHLRLPSDAMVIDADYAACGINPPISVHIAYGFSKMAMSKAEQAALEALKNGATFAEAMDLLPKPTPAQLAELDEYGDFLQPSERFESFTPKSEASSRPLK